MTTHIRTKASSKEVKKIIASIPSIIAGNEKDPLGLHNRFWGAVALSMYESLNKAFERKAQGQQDDLGNTWDDILPHTKAYSRKPQTGDLSRSQRRGYSDTSTIGLLTPNQYKKWKKIFGHIYHKEKERLGENEAKKLAGQIAWTRLKQEGADTKIRALGNRKLLILRDTDKLYRSFLPGKLTARSYRKYNRDQIYVVEKGKITIGTKVEYASEVFEDRPLWHGDIGPWIKKASRAGISRITLYLKETLDHA